MTKRTQTVGLIWRMPFLPEPTFIGDGGGNGQEHRAEEQRQGEADRHHEGREAGTSAHSHADGALHIGGGKNRTGGHSQRLQRTENTRIHGLVRKVVMPA